MTSRIDIHSFPNEPTSLQTDTKNEEKPRHVASSRFYTGSQRLQIDQYTQMVDVSSEHHNLHLQFSLLFDFIMVRYAVDVFKADKFKWSKSAHSRGIRKPFSYRYFNDNDVYASYSKVCTQVLAFRKLFRENKWSFVIQSDYIEFINRNLAVVVNELFIPMEENNTNISPMIPANISAIVEQFRKTVAETRPKSSKINYVVAKELGLL